MGGKLNRKNATDDQLHERSRKRRKVTPVAATPVVQDSEQFSIITVPRRQSTRALSRIEDVPQRQVNARKSKRNVVKGMNGSEEPNALATIRRTQKGLTGNIHNEDNTSNIYTSPVVSTVSAPCANSPSYQMSVLLSSLESLDCNESDSNDIAYNPPHEEKPSPAATMYTPKLLLFSSPNVYTGSTTQKLTPNSRSKADDDPSDYSSEGDANVSERLRLYVVQHCLGEVLTSLCGLCLVLLVAIFGYSLAHMPNTPIYTLSLQCIMQVNITEISWSCIHIMFPKWSIVTSYEIDEVIRTAL